MFDESNRNAMEMFCGWKTLRLWGCVLTTIMAVVSSPAFAQFRELKTIAGTGKTGEITTSQLALEAVLSNPFGVEPSSDGSLIVTSYDQHVVYRLAALGGKLERIAGSGKMGAIGKNGDRALEVEFNQPHEARVDRNGNIYIADTRNHRVGVVDAKLGTWKIIAGTGSAGFSGDGGPADQAQLNGPHSIALDGDQLFIADLTNHRIRQINLTTGRIATVAGTGKPLTPTDGQSALMQPLHGPRSLAIDSDNLWIVLREGNSIWRLDRKSGSIHHIAGTGAKGFSGDGGPALKATFNGPKGIAVDPGKSLYIVDTENHAIRKVSLVDLSISTVVGSPIGTRGFNDDGSAQTVRMLARPHGVALWPRGGIVIGDSENHRVRLAIP